MGKIRYIGSKLRIASQIINSIPFNPNQTFCDIFSGTGSVSREAATLGWKVSSNDYLFSAKILSLSQLISRKDVPFESFGGYEKVVNILNMVDGYEGPITKEYTPSAKSLSGHSRSYFTCRNGMKIDAVRKLIEEWFCGNLITSNEYHLLIADLLRATNSVANIAGTYGGYLKKFNTSSNREILLETHDLLKTPVLFTVSQKDVFDYKANHDDIIYMDPPYTKRQYPAYYHILETIAYGDYPNVDGITGLRPWRHLASRFCYKQKALNSLVELIENIGAKQFYISYSSDGHVKIDDFSNRLKTIGDVSIIDLGYIGKYRPNVKASKNSSSVKEYLIDFKLKEVKYSANIKEFDCLYG